MEIAMTTALDLAFELATRPGFDCLHDPNTATVLIESYHDPVGYPTIGYGRLLSRIPASSNNTACRMTVGVT